MSTILITDDEPAIRRSLAGLLSDEGFQTEEAAEGEQALSLLRAGRADLVLLDIAMPGRDGIQVLEEMRRGHPQLPVIMMSGHGNIETAVQATQIGAFDFIEKPLVFEKLLLTINHALEAKRLADENRALRAGQLAAHEILGESEVITRLKTQIRQAAPTDAWVLIRGENGTGKELVARNLHLLSRRCEGPFIEVNCAAIPEALIESELFGHEKGAFTGAVARKHGKFELAHGGTIFLDEIGDMSLRTQAKILRILQEHRFERVGGNEPIEVDVRVFAATNKKLEEEIERGRFREDLYYRLNVIPFQAPALRERVGDIRALVEAFVTEFCIGSGLKRKKVHEDAMRVLEAYPWPGNVRELRNLVERMVLMTPGEAIRRADLPEALRGEQEPAAALTLEQARRDFERRFLARRLEENDWNISRTAEAVGIARESLSRKMKRYGIRSP